MARRRTDSGRRGRARTRLARNGRDAAGARRARAQSARRRRRIRRAREPFRRARVGPRRSAIRCRCVATGRRVRPHRARARDRNRREPAPRARGRGPRRRRGPPHGGAAYRVRCTRAMGSRRCDPHRHRCTRLPPRARRPRVRREPRAGARARGNEAARPECPGVARRLPARRYARAPGSDPRRVPRVGPVASPRGVGRERGVRLARVRVRCCAGSRCCRARDSRSPSSSASRRPRASNHRCSARPRSRA